MHGVQLQDFIKDRFPAMIDYITVISSPVHDILILNYDGNQLDQLDVVNTLQSQHLADLERIHTNSSTRGHQLDIPKHLAIVKSFVVTITHNKKPTTTTETWQSKSFIPCVVKSKERLYGEFAK